MKNFVFIFLGLIFLFSLISCDLTSTTEINIRNSSSYDLRITFILPYPSQLYVDEIVAMKDTITLYTLRAFSVEAPDPNSTIKEIIFLNLEDSSFIKRLENDNLFIETGRKQSTFGSETVYYSLEITDALF